MSKSTSNEERCGCVFERQIKLDQSVTSYHAVSDKNACRKRLPDQLSLRARKVMIIILIILVFALASVGFLLTVRRYSRALPEKEKEKALPPLSQTGLFAEPDAEIEQTNHAEEEIRTRRIALIERATEGDTNALADAAAAGDGRLYEEVLDALISASERQGNLPALVKRIAESNELRANVRLAERVIESWKLAPARRSTIEMMHVAALSDDAETYAKAVEEAIEGWRDGKLSDFRAEELIALVESQYWVLASKAREGGAGYHLKSTLADARRLIAAATRVG